VEASDIRRDTSGEHQKKAYEKPKLNLKQRLQQNADQQSSIKTDARAKINIARRQGEPRFEHGKTFGFAPQGNAELL